jgi:DNA-binding XRE family transcriptional regulator
MSTNNRRTSRDHRYDIGVLIGLAREDANHTQTKAAAFVGVSQTKWNHWEKSVALPSVEEMDSIIQLYFAHDRSKMSERYLRAVEDWDRLKPPVPTRTYDTPGGKSGDPYRRDT